MSDSSNRLPPLVIDDADKELYGHLPKLVDGVTGGDVTDSTTLVALHQIAESDILHDFIGVAKPKVLCQVADSEGTVHGPDTLENSHGYRILVTFDKLLVAPILRIECLFLDSRGACYHRVGLEFHFNPFDGKESQIEEYTQSSNRITFTSKKASSFGFNKAKCPTVQARFRHREQAILALLSSFIAPESRHRVKLILHSGHLGVYALRKLAKIRARLPGGSEPLLKSIDRGMEYACYGEHLTKVAAGNSILLGPRALMNKLSPHPFIPFTSSDTFASVKQAAVELVTSANILHEEECEALRLWSSKGHRGTLLVHGNSVVVGIKFNNFPTLRGRSKSVRYRLPRELSCKLTFTIPGKANARREEFEAFLVSNIAGLPPGFDAYFIIIKNLLGHFRPRVIDPKTGRPSQRKPTKMEPPSTDSFGVICTPHIPCFTFKSQMETAAQLQDKKNERWHAVLLNQVHDVLKAHDMTKGHGVSPHAKLKADRWLRGWVAWNAEQLEVIDGIERAPGGLVVIVGPAGTGKTLLQQALAIYFYKLGFHVLTLSPANSNANHLAAETKKMKERFPDLADVEFLRLFPGSRDHSVESMMASQGAHRQVGHEEGHALPLSELLFSLEELEKDEGVTHEYGVVETVVSAALNRTMVLNKRLENSGREYGSMVNAWDVLREFIDRYRQECLDDHLGKYTDEQYRKAYLQCKGHVVGRNRWLTTTTGNVLSMEMKDHWFSEEEVYGVPRLGVIVFVDEAAKDLEINAWAGIVAERWAAYVKGVFLLGDDKQLQPANTSAKGEVIFNYYSDRVNISLLGRLVRENFPHYSLLEQRRMTASIAAFPNHTIYNDMLRNGPGMNKILEMCLPGFGVTLSDIIVQSTSITPQEREQYKEPDADPRLRLHWIEVDGKRQAQPFGSSLIVHSHVAVFFKTIYPSLREFFDRTEQKMWDHIMIICGYSFALHEYEHHIGLLRKANPNLTKADMPRVLTVDSAQGSESMMVIFDGSFQHGDVVGFLSDKGRANVAFTRAKEVFWIIGGRMEIAFPRNPQKPNLMLDYKLVMDKEKISHHFE